MPLAFPRLWRLASINNITELHLADHSSLDALTDQLPAGFYTTFRTYANCTRALDLEKHLNRLYQPVRSPKVTRLELRALLLLLLDQFTNEARLRLIMTTLGSLFVAIEDLVPLPTEIYANGVRVATTDLEREHPRLKSTSFIRRSALQRKQITGKDVFELLLVSNGLILEGLTSNFFYVKAGVLGTALKDVLLGVTRRIIIRLARQLEISLKFSPLRCDQLSLISEAFITSSSRAVVPVVRINDHPVGQGTPGPVTRKLSKCYESYVINHAESISKRRQ